MKIDDLLNDDKSKINLFEKYFIPAVSSLPSSSVSVILESKQREINQIQEDLRKHYEVFNSMSPSLREISSMSLVAGSLRDLCFDSPINDLDVYIEIDAEKVKDLGKSFFVKEYSKLSLAKQEEFQNIIIDRFCGTMEKIHPNGFDLEKLSSPGRKLFVPPTVAQTKDTFNSGKFWDVFFEPKSFDFVNFFQSSQTEMKIEMALVFLNNDYQKSLKSAGVKVDDFYLSELKNKEYSEGNLSSFFKYHEEVKLSSYSSRGRAKKETAIKYEGVHGLNAVLKLNGDGFNYPSDIMFGFFPSALFISKFDFNISQMVVPVNESSLSNKVNFISQIRITESCAEGISKNNLNYYFFFGEDFDEKSEKFTKRIKERMSRNKNLKVNFLFENVPLFDENDNAVEPSIKAGGSFNNEHQSWGTEMIEQFHKAQSFINKQILNIEIEKHINLTSVDGEDMINNSSFKL